MPRTNAVVYKDFDISFTTHPVTRKLNVLKNDLAVARSVKNLILTNKNERPYQLNVGSNVRNRLFEPADSFTGQKIRSDITEKVGLTFLNISSIFPVESKQLVPLGQALEGLVYDDEEVKMLTEKFSKTAYW